jgi:hypothetical protein
MFLSDNFLAAVVAIDVLLDVGAKDPAVTYTPEELVELRGVSRQLARYLDEIRKFLLKMPFNRKSDVYQIASRDEFVTLVDTLEIGFWKGENLKTYTNQMLGRYERSIIDSKQRLGEGQSNG